MKEWRAIDIDQGTTISLLWPTEESRLKYKDEIRLSERCHVDLGIDQIVQGICLNHDYVADIKRLLVQLCDDPAVIQYRQDIMEDFMNLPGLGTDFEQLVPLIRKLDEYRSPKYVLGTEELRAIAWRLEILSLYTECTTKLHASLDKYKQDLRSEGLCTLHKFMEEWVQSDDYQALVSELPDLRNRLQGISSITIGINLDNEMRPAQAIILSAESRPFRKRKRSFMSNILGLKSVEEDYMDVPQFQDILGLDNTAIENALFKNLEEVFKAALTPIGISLQRYIHVNVRKITSLHFDLLYYVGASKLFRKLRSVGLKLCKPQIAPTEERVYQVEQLTDFILSYTLNRQHPEILLGQVVVGNQVEFGEQGRIFILTGPNQGGKTTYTRAIGVSQVLFQAGLFVPGSEAYMSPVDWIYTHFSEEELPNINDGRLGEESKRLAQIFENATSHSLILLNESLSSTSPSDSLYLARDLVKGIKLIGCRAVFATHLLELAANVDEINQEIQNNCQVISMVAGILYKQERRDDDPVTKRTYKVEQGPPMHMSYARDIAYRHGISYDQIKAKLQERKML